MNEQDDPSENLVQSEVFQSTADFIRMQREKVHSERKAASFVIVGPDGSNAIIRDAANAPAKETKVKPENIDRDSKPRVTSSEKNSGNAATAPNRRAERWGMRDYKINDKGDAIYAFREEDTLWSIAQDVLMHASGAQRKRLLLKDIQAAMNKLARINRIEDPLSIKPGQVLVIR